MKQITLFGLIIFMCSAIYAQHPDSLWSKANAAYAEGDFPAAAGAYTEIEKSGKVSSDLYFNIGNAYFKQQHLPEAILYYERARKLQPDDKDILHNLDIAKAQTLDKVEVMPEFIVNTWIKDLRMALGADTWAVFALLALVGGLLFFGFFFFAANIRFRKFSFFLSVVSAIFMVVCFVFAAEQKKEMTDHSEAIIFPAVVSVKSAPNQNGKDLFIIHEGTKVIIMETLKEWQRIQLLDGKEGWIAANTTQRI